MIVQFKDYKCLALGHTYQNGRKAIELLEYDSPHEPVAFATVNIPQIDIPDDCVFIKDYSENKGILQSLINANIIDHPAILTVNQGFVNISAYPLTQIALNQLF